MSDNRLMSEMLRLQESASKCVRTMAQEQPNRLVEWFLLLRKQTPVLRQRAAEWLGQVREEPRLLWETPTIRYAVFGVSGLLLVWVILFFVHLVTPPPPASARPAATTADFHVLCTHADCGHHFVINRPFGFRKFPVTCPKCSRQSGMAARPCNSATCNRRWVAPQRIDGRLQCPLCGAGFD